MNPGELEDSNPAGIESSRSYVIRIRILPTLMAGTTFPITSETATVPTFSEPVVQLRLLFMMPR